MKFQTASLVLFLSLIFFTGAGHAQVRAGATLLKMNPGIRHHGMGSANTGVIDDIHAFYANPAATAFIPDWEWATSYSKWFADTGIFSFVYGNNLPLAIDRQTKFALGLHYLDYGTFNSTDASEFGDVSAGDALFSLSLARPLTFLSSDFSLGANLKYFSSRLDDVSASSFIVDFGALYKFPQIFNFIFSAGASITQLGQPLNYMSVDTPLPNSSRAGFSVNYHPRESRIYLQLNADYIQTLDESDAIHVGGEFNYNNAFYVRSGYQFNEKTLSRLTFGAGFRFNAGRKSDMRIDAAVLEGNEIFAPPLRAGVHHFSVGPDDFAVYPTSDSTYFPADRITFRWQNLNSRDMFEQYSYIVVLARENERGFLDKLRHNTTGVKAVLAEAQKNKDILLLSFTPDDAALKLRRNNVFVTHSLFPDTLNYALGDYEWTVVAVDPHGLYYSVAHNTEHFEITLPDLEILLNDFVPKDKGCENAVTCCGDIHLTIRNNRDIAARQFYIKFYESDKDAVQLAEILTNRESIREHLLAAEKTNDVPVLKIDHIGRLGRIDTTIAWTRKPDSIVRSLIGVVDFHPEYENWTGVLEIEEFENNFHVLELPFPDLQLNLKPVPPVQVDKSDILVQYNVVLKNLSPFAAQGIEGEINSESVITSDSDYMDSFGRFNIKTLAPFDSLIVPILLRSTKEDFEIVINSRVSSDMCDLDASDNTAADTLALYDVAIAVGQIPPLQPKVLFQTGKDELTETSKMLLDRVVDDLSDVLRDGDLLRVTGHTDTTGTVAYNDTISSRRADIVKQYILAEKSNLNVAALGFGERHPGVIGNAEHRDAENKRNRRVELDILANAPESIIRQYVIPQQFRKPAVFAGYPLVDTLYVRNDGRNPVRLFDIHVPFLHAVVLDSVLEASGLSVHQENGNRIRIRDLAAGESIKIPYLWKPDVEQHAASTVVTDSVWAETPWDVAVGNNSATRTFIVLPPLPNLPPEALKVRIAGAPTVGETLSANYIYFDIESDMENTSDSGTRMSWRAGDKILSQQKTLTLDASHIGSRIGVHVQPRAQTGDEIGSVAEFYLKDPISINTPPRVEQVKIVGAYQDTLAVVESVLSIDYTFVDDEGDPEDKSLTTIEWSIGDKRAFGSSYKVELDDRGKTITVTVSPAAKSGIRIGEPSGSVNHLHVPRRLSVGSESQQK